MSRPLARIVGIAAMLPRSTRSTARRPNRRSGDLHRKGERVDGHRPLDVLRVDMTLADRQRAGGLLGRGDETGRLGRPQRLPESRPLDQLGCGEIVSARVARRPAPPVIT
jgi:hypothetical protein